MGDSAERHDKPKDYPPVNYIYVPATPGVQSPDDIIRHWPSDEPPKSHDGFFLPGISEPPSFNPETETREPGALEVEFESGQPVRVRQLWTVRALTAEELDAIQLDSELAQLSTAIDDLVAHRQTLNGTPTNADYQAAIRYVVTVQIRVLRYIRRNIS